MGFLELYPHHPWIPATELYDCSNRTDEEWAARGTPRPIMGGFAVLSGGFVFVLYVLTFIAMTNRDVLKHPCYQVMYFTTWVDIFNLTFSNLVTGFYLIVGAVFCTYPKSIYFFGGMCIGTYCCSSLSIVILGFGRLAEVTGYCESMFEGRMTAFWISLCMTYCVFTTFVTRPMLFNSTAGVWILAPFTTDDLQKELDTHRNVVLVANNLLSPITIAIVYIIIFITLFSKQKENIDQKTESFRKKLLLQCTLICLTQAFVGFTFFCLIIFPTPHWFLFVAESAYQLNEWTPPVACLIFNINIRNRVLSMLGMKSSAVGSIYSTSNQPQGSRTNN